MASSMAGLVISWNTMRLVFFLVQAEHLAEMPRYGLSLAVFIGCEPYFL